MRRRWTGSPTSSQSSTRPGGGTFSEPERVAEILNRMPDQVLEDEAYRNAKMNSDRQNAQIEHDSAVRRLVTAMVRCQTELYKAYTGDADFREWLNGEMFRRRTKPAPDSASKTEHLPIAAHRGVHGGEDPCTFCWRCPWTIRWLLTKKCHPGALQPSLWLLWRSGAVREP